MSISCLINSGVDNSPLNENSIIINPTSHRFKPAWVCTNSHT